MRKKLSVLLLLQQILQFMKYVNTVNYLPPRKYTTPEVAKYYGYPMQSHEVMTEDGWFLTLFRIPHSKSNDDITYRVPVLLCHGATTNSIVWVIYGTENGLGFALADEGFDVWLINFRSSVHSQKHKYLSRKNDSYWNFSFHEIAIYDVPAANDYIQTVKRAESSFLSEDPKIIFLGHSQGASEYYVLLSEKPEYNDKIIAGITMAPVTFSGHSKSPANRKTAVKLNSSAMLTMNILGELRPDHNQALVMSLCPMPLFTELCHILYTYDAGFNPELADTEYLMWILASVHDCASIKQNLHIAQFIISGKFCHYDYGALNVQYYGQEQPYDYKLSNIKTSTYILYSDGDWVADKTDIMLLASKLRNVTLYKVPYPPFGHIDFLFSTKTQIYVNKKVIEFARKYKMQPPINQSSKFNWIPAYFLALLLCVVLHKYCKR